MPTADALPGRDQPIRSTEDPRRRTASAHLGRAVALGGGVAVALLAARELETTLARHRSARARPRSTFASPRDPRVFAHADELQPGVSDAYELEPPLQDDALPRGTDGR